MTMDERTQHIFVALALFMVIKHVIVALLAFQHNVMYEQNVEMMLMVVFVLA
jgi:hypothetical protein